MYTRRCLLLGLLACGLLPAQDGRPSVRVLGAVGRPLTLSAEDLAKMPRTTAHATVKGVETAYTGVRLHEILKAAGVPQGEDLRGKALATCVIAGAQDGYEVVFSLAELDPSIGGNDVLLADTADARPLAGRDGTFRLVVPHDKTAARSVRLLDRIEVVALRK